MEERIKNLFINLLKNGKKYIDYKKCVHSTDNPFFNKGEIHYSLPSYEIHVHRWDNETNPRYIIFINGSEYDVTGFTKLELYTYDELFMNMIDFIREEVLNTIESELGNDSEDEDF